MKATHPARGLLGNTTTAGRVCENCNRRLRSTFLEHTLCPTCYYATKTCVEEGVDHLSELSALSASALLWRVSDILRRSGVSDADQLIRQLEILVG